MASPEKQHNLCAVTGAGGFIGSHLVQMLLEKGHCVRALVHYNALGSRGHLEEVLRCAAGADTAWLRENRLEIVAGDIQDPRAMHALVRGADVVFHLAALIGIPYSYTSPQTYVNVNIGGTLNILEACRDENVGLLIHTSTSETLGTAQYEPQDERHPQKAQSPYAATKIGADRLVESYHLSFSLPAVILRPFNTYGPRQSARAVIPSILAQALTHGRNEIQLGALDPVRDLTYVEDTARAFIMVADAPREVVSGKLYHLGTGNGISIGNLAKLALRVLGIEKPVVEDPGRIRPETSEVFRLISDNSLIRREVGWAPRVALAEGLEQTADWLMRNLMIYRPDEYSR